MNYTAEKLILLTIMALLLLSSSYSWARNGIDECTEKGLIDQISCLSDLAVDNNDASLCNEATHDGVKYQCYAVAAEKLADWKTCLEIPPKSKNFRDSCYLKVKNRTGDLALCEKISEPGFKSSCTGEPVMVK